MRRIVIAGAFDTKSLPLKRLIDELAEKGSPALTIDTGVYGSDFPADYPAGIVAASAGYELEDLRTRGRAKAVEAMADGAAKIAKELGDDGRLGAIVCMGGSNAGVVFAKIVSQLPIGVPKILMATVVAGDTRPLVAANDVILLYPIVDIEGDNSILRGMISRLARTAIAACDFPDLLAKGDVRRSVALSMFGVTTPCVSMCREYLGEAGLESFVFHANGTGGRSLESFVAQGMVSSVIDVTITELADELCGGFLPAGPNRLANAARIGIPQVIAPGAIDMINFGPMSSVPERFRDRKLLAHNEHVTLVRTTPEENYSIGTLAAQRLGNPLAPTEMVVPLRGVSMLDMEGKPFYDPSSVKSFVEGFRAGSEGRVALVELDLHINDRQFARELVTRAVRGRSAIMAARTERSG